jgi:hypothetical protein
MPLLENTAGKEGESCRKGPLHVYTAVLSTNKQRKGFFAEQCHIGRIDTGLRKHSGHGAKKVINYTVCIFLFL